MLEVKIKVKVSRLIDAMCMNQNPGRWALGILA